MQVELHFEAKIWVIMLAILIKRVLASKMEATYEEFSSCCASQRL
tara:strand:+ start:11626 stop:11760 length:135 start_codon:yes stop_codon:yes gene_type:complete